MRRITLVLPLAALVLASGCASSAPSVGECRGHMAAGVLAGVIGGVLAADEVRDGDASTRDRVIGGTAGGVAGAAGGYALCVREVRQRQALQMRFAALEQQISAEKKDRLAADATLAQAVGAPPAEEVFTHELRGVDRRATAVILQGRFFDDGSTEFTPRAALYMDQIADLLVDEPTTLVTIIVQSGTSSTDGGAAPQSELLVRYLVRQGVAAERFVTQTAGAKGDAAPSDKMASSDKLPANDKARLAAPVAAVGPATTTGTPPARLRVEFYLLPQS